MKKLILTLVLIGALFVVQSQNITVSGHVYVQGSLESLPGSLIYEPVSQAATSTNAYGFYTLTIPYRENMYVVFSCFGHGKDTLWISSAQNWDYDAQLVRNTTLDEVNITVEKNNTEKVQMSTISISAKEIRALPMLLGEKDAFKTLVLLPGVQSGAEGTSGLYVRGGGPDQNLIILDEASIYNANHLLGFFSIFNGDAIKSIELIKGGFPAHYGGRLSSVIDITTNDGDKASYHGEGGIGILSSNMMVEGPIIKQTASFMLSGRITYFDLLAAPIMKIATDGMVTGYYFFDLNGKFNFNLGKKDKLYLSAYFGRDKFHLSETYKEDKEKEKIKMGLYWQNATATVRWNHLFTQKIFSNLSFVFSDYVMNVYSKEHQIDRYGEEPVEYDLKMNFNSGIRDYTLKYDVSFVPNPVHKIGVGAQITYHESRPNAMMFNEDTISIHKVQKERGLEYSIYVEDEIIIRSRFRIYPGLRLTAFSVPQKTYFSPEPRISLSYNILQNLSLKASYAMMSQCLILLTTSTIGLPSDLWVPVTKDVKPQRSQQVAAGIHYDLKKPRLSFSLEGYYKRMNNILAYREGSSYFVDLIEGLYDATTVQNENTWSRNVTAGNGWSAGMEFLVRKDVGKFTGWIGYTLSWTKHQFEELNFGKPFFARYDRRHDISVVLMYAPKPNIHLSLAWTYATGNAVTLPTSLYQGETISVSLEQLLYGQSDASQYNYYSFIENYGDKNNLRMKPFHHLDIGVQFIKRHEKWQSIFEISIYNVYNHKNPFFYFVSTEEDETTGVSSEVIKQVCIFPIIPSFTYHFKF